MACGQVVLARALFVSGMDIPIYVISLARALERRASIGARLNAAGVQYEIVDAVDGRALDLESLGGRLRNDIAYRRYQHRLTGNEIACFLSHYNLWARMLDEQTPYALILEDDACWSPGFFDVVAALPNCGWRWEYALLSGGEPRRVESHLCDLPHGHRLVRHHRPGWTTAAYLITLTGAAKAHRQCHTIDGHADGTMRQYWRFNLAFYEVTPAPAWQSDAPSQIGYAHRTPLSPAEKRRRSLMRNYRGFRRKLYHHLHKPARQK